MHGKSSYLRLGFSVLGRQSLARSITIIIIIIINLQKPEEEGFLCTSCINSGLFKVFL
jgi:hypothetical protein